MPTDTVASLKDYSGSNNNATATVGTAPTIIAGTGGCNFTGNGAIILPTALNSALTIQVLVSYQQTNDANIFDAPVCSNGGGALVNVSCLLLQRGNGVFSVVSAQNPVAGPIPFNDLGGKTVGPSRTIINGTAVLSWSMAAVDHVYINNDEICQDPTNGTAICPGGSSSSAGRNLFPYQLGGSAAGSGVAAQTYYTGQIYAWAFYSTAKTAAEIAQGVAILTADATNRGITVALGQNPGATGNCQLVHDGDSQTAGGGALTTYYPAIVVENTGCTWDIFNGGGAATALVWAGNSASGAKYQADTMIRKFNPGAATQTPFNVVTAWLATNDCIEGSPLTASQIYQRWANYVRNRKAAGFNKVLVSTMISRTQASCSGASCDPCKNIINPVLRQNWRNFNADGFVDMGATQLGADGACVSGGASGRLCSDSVHPTQDAEYNIVALNWQRGINGLFGNYDFSTATTYVAAAPAAVTITAASEATNTMTFTSASGAPAVSSCAVVLGVTPAGYNTPADSCWNVLTSNGSTSWTAYNGTTGLGAGTVFGTFSVPLQKDQDNYVVLNFGTGNFTLQPCWMQMGIGEANATPGGLPAIAIKNINAAASTIVPWSTEQIDGAANFTLAGNSTAYFAPILISSSAAGCNWRVVPQANLATTTLKKGTGAGNYSSASTSYVQVDGTNLINTVTIPLGWKLLVQVSGSVTTSTAIATASLALTDNAVVLQELQSNPTAATNFEAFSLSWIITGDGASHPVDLRYKTSNGADSVTLLNSTATLTPTMTFTLLPSN